MQSLLKSQLPFFFFLVEIGKIQMEVQETQNSSQMYIEKKVEDSHFLI